MISLIAVTQATTLLLLFGGTLSSGVQNVTVTEVNSSTMKFNWSLSAVPKHIPLYYLICHPDESFHGDIVQFTRLTSLVLTGFAVGIEYTCTLSTMGTSEKIQKYSVHVQAKRLGGTSIDFVNETPSVQGTSIVAEFQISGSVTTVVCCLNPKPNSGNKCVQCMNGKVSYSDVSPGYYSLTVVLKNSNYDTLVVKRLITVPDSSYSCAVNLVNNGFTISDGTVTLQFAGVGQVTGYACYLDGQVYGSDCSSPLLVEGLESGSHSFKIIPVGDNCVERLPLKVNYQI